MASFLHNAGASQAAVLDALDSAAVIACFAALMTMHVIWRGVGMYRILLRGPAAASSLPSPYMARSGHHRAPRSRRRSRWCAREPRSLLSPS